ncbi:unnamed protein product [Macrosiphum euphorbiae]|uniref:Uncharacterized protein n=1 Tax=Macrosiphum euphorbiae TaxID=13131 RepID=A0AAV0W7M9_9HEMI|nr:unnamed protein product [Macrosiphum euphorbiae]
MLYFVNVLTVQLFLIVVLASIRKLMDLIRKLHKKWIELDDDPRFNLDFGCQHLLKDTPVGQANHTHGTDKFTQKDHPAPRFRRRSSSRKGTWARPSFRQEKVAVDRSDFSSPPVLNKGPDVGFNLRLDFILCHVY